MLRSMSLTEQDVIKWWGCDPRSSSQQSGLPRQLPGAAARFPRARVRTGHRTGTGWGAGPGCVLDYWEDTTGGPPPPLRRGPAGILQAGGGSALPRPGEARGGTGPVGVLVAGPARFSTPGPGNRSGRAPSVRGPARACAGPGLHSADGRGVADRSGILGGHRSPRPLGLQEVTEPLEGPCPDLGDTTFGDAEELRDLDEGLALHERK